MKVYVVHVWYEAAVEGVFYTEQAAEQHMNKIRTDKYYGHDCLFVMEYEVRTQ